MAKNMGSGEGMGSGEEVEKWRGGRMWQRAWESKGMKCDEH